MEIVLAGTKLKTSKDFHREIKKILDFPDYYGENLDALWDCLTTMSKTPITLIWKDFQTSKMYLGDFADSVSNIFNDAQIVVCGFAVYYQ